MHEIEEDDELNEYEDEGDESVDMYSKTSYNDELFIGINWQQEAIEQKLNDDAKNEPSVQEGHESKNLNHNQFRSMEDDSNSFSLLN